MNGTTNSSSRKRKRSSSLASLLLFAGLVFTVIDSWYLLSYIERTDDAGSNVLVNNENQQLQRSATVGDDGGKEPILQLIRDAGISIEKDLDKETLDRLPTWSQVA
jgi:hypothetical protein